MIVRQAPELQTTHWLNTDAPLLLEHLRGRVVVIEAFQMLCPGCVSHGLPQAKRVAETFHSKDVCVLGLHTVFEHHSVQGTVEALAAFLHEYRITFPVAIDAPSGNGGAPKTMTAYDMRGTPTLLLVDRRGIIRKQIVGAEPDMVIGAQIASLVCDRQTAESRAAATVEDQCDDKGCTIPGLRDVDSDT